MNETLSIILGVLGFFNIVCMLWVIMLKYEGANTDWEDIRLWHLILMPGILLGLLLSLRLFKKKV